MGNLTNNLRRSGQSPPDRLTEIANRVLEEIVDGLGDEADGLRIVVMTSRDEAGGMVAYGYGDSTAEAMLDMLSHVDAGLTADGWACRIEIEAPPGARLPPGFRWVEPSGPGPAPPIN